MIDFSVFYKQSYLPENINKISSYDLFISAFDDCDRTNEVYKNIISKKKLWFIFPHYNKIEAEKLPQENYYSNVSFEEDEYFLEFISQNLIDDKTNLCIDSSGFIKPHLIYLLKYLSQIGVKKVDILYSEPQQYLHADETTFSGFINNIDSIKGCSSVNINSNKESDLLILGAGYDDNLIAKVAQDKKYCKNKFYILGFPSLQPDMYQESVLKIFNAKESIGENLTPKFAPANDPFITASVIQEIIDNTPATNIYLSPLSTKPQTIGFALYYIWNYKNKPISLVYPYSNYYSSHNAVGINRTWKYTFEFPSA